MIREFYEAISQVKTSSPIIFCIPHHRYRTNHLALIEDLSQNTHKEQFPNALFLEG